MNAIAPFPLRHRYVAALTFPPSSGPHRNEVVDWPLGLCVVSPQTQDVRTTRVRFTNDEPPGEDWCLGGQDTIHAQGYEFLLRCDHHTIRRSLLASYITWEVIEDYCFAYEAAVRQWWDAGHRLLGTTQDGMEALFAGLADRGVAVPDRAGVDAYLKGHPALPPLLEEFCADVTGRLGAQNEYHLRLFRDPDGDSEFLVLTVRAPQYAEDFYERLDAIQEPYHDRLLATSGWVQLSTDFQKPGRPDAVARR